MEKRSSITTKIFRLALIATLLSAVVLLVIFKLGGFKVDVSYLIISIFTCFVCAFISLYFFYYVDVAKDVKYLADKIRQKFQAKEIPSKRNQLEEADALDELEERVDDLIESRQQELEQIKNLDSYRKEYLGNVSHELKTPVFNIQGYIDTLLNGGLEDPEINVNYLKRAEKSIDRLIHIIDDLETITQLESGHLHLDLDNYDLAAQVKDVYSALELTAAKKNIKLELSKKYDKSIMVHADKFRIRQVLVNLITNSIKYGKENGTTTINLFYLNNDVIVEVSDNGPGIEPSHLNRIFERFYRVDKGRSREQGGTGLGLAIVKHIIDAHQKSIKAESIFGKGTTFTFSLSAAE